MISSTVQIGDVFGELTVEAQLPTLDSRQGRRWLLRCDCGGTAIRTSSSLGQAVRNGAISCCRECLRELNAGSWEWRVRSRHDLFLSIWREHRELYTTVQLGHLENDIREEVGLELGGWRTSLDHPPGIGDLDIAPDTERPVDDDGMDLGEVAKLVDRLYDLNDGEGKAVRGISRERVRQIESDALAKLRNPNLIGHRTLKRFHETGVPAGVDGLDAAHDAYVEAEPIVRVHGPTLERALARAITGKKNDQRPAWCPPGDVPEEVPAVHRAAHMALIDAAIVRARETEKIVRELIEKSRNVEVYSWEWWGIPSTMRPGWKALPEPTPKERKQILRRAFLSQRSSSSYKGTPEGMAALEAVKAMERARRYPYRWAWRSRTAVAVFFWTPVPPIVAPAVPERPKHRSIAWWIKNELEGRRS